MANWQMQMLRRPFLGLDLCCDWPSGDSAFALTNALIGTLL
jgi:hypothetical protein